MTYEEALKHTEQTIALSEGVGIFKDNLDYWIKVKEAIEKQIKEKPVECKNECARANGYRHECSICGHVIGKNDDDFIGLSEYEKYCPECGQAIDWSDEK